MTGSPSIPLEPSHFFNGLAKHSKTENPAGPLSPIVSGPIQFMIFTKQFFRDFTSMNSYGLFIKFVEARKLGYWHDSAYL